MTIIFYFLTIWFFSILILNNFIDQKKKNEALIQKAKTSNDVLKGKMVVYKDELYKVKKGILNLRGIEISDINNILGLEELKNLKNLDLSNNNISEIRGLENLSNLLALNLSYNNLKNLKGIENLINLEYLNVSNNKVEDLKGISNLANLSTLNITNNYISSIDELKSLKSLKILYLKGNNIKDEIQDQLSESLSRLDSKEPTVRVYTPPLKKSIHIDIHKVMIVVIIIILILPFIFALIFVYAIAKSLSMSYSRALKLTYLPVFGWTVVIYLGIFGISFLIGGFAGLIEEDSDMILPVSICFVILLIIIGSIVGYQLFKGFADRFI